MLRDRIDSPDAPYPLISPCGLERLEDRVLLSGDVLAGTQVAEEPAEASATEAPAVVESTFDVDPGGPYELLAGDDLILYATNLTDVANPYNIQSAAWDLDGDGQFDDAFGSYVTLVLWDQMTTLGLTEGQFTIGVQATDFAGATGTATTTLSISYGPEIEAGQAAGIWFWRGSRGQQLIDTFIESGWGTDFAIWMAGPMPKTFGPGGALSLIGKTNDEVGLLFKDLFRLRIRDGVALAPKAEARLLAVGLSTYVTSLAAGPEVNALAAEYGFQISAGGLADSTFVAGFAGRFIGLSESLPTTVSDFLWAADQYTGSNVITDDGTLSESFFIGDIDGDGHVERGELVYRLAVNWTCMKIIWAGRIW